MTAFTLYEQPSALSTPRRNLRVLLLVGSVLVVASCARFPTKSPAAAWGPVPTGAGATFTPGADRDGDGVTDDREAAMRSHPDQRDSDGDGYDDGFEDQLADFGFDLVRPDADRDHDGLTDAREARLHTNPAASDSDADGWSDFDEVLNEYFGFDPRTPTADTDFDGLADPLERRLGSSPAKVDSNGDGISDFQAYSADLPPNGPALKGTPAELIGVTYSPAMADALQAIRDGSRFPDKLAGQLPYPQVTASLVAAGMRPSAALMQRSLYNPHNSPGVYPTYAQIEQDLFALAQAYDGSPNTALVRLFYWTGQTVESCGGELPRPGRKVYAVKVSANPGANEPEPEVAFLGVHHARELISGAETMRLLHTLTDGYATNSEIRKRVDTREIWVIPVVNPNGYERAVGSQVDWRKNTRFTKGQTTKCGTDLNRNYDFDHVSGFSPAQRAMLPGAFFNGINTTTGNLAVDSDQYPGEAPFSEVETQAVRGLAHSQFLSHNREVDGLVCSLSWHSYTGVVMHPLAHSAVPPNTGVDAPDVATFDALTKDIATATGYKDLQDDFPTSVNFDGCGMSGYPSYGEASDWLYKDGRTFAVSIESYSTGERGHCPLPNNLPDAFYPLDAAKRDAVADNNVKAALALLRDCPE